MVDFQISGSELVLIRKIVKRARTMEGLSAVELDMDIAAVHRNGCPLDLEKLLAFDDFNFLHDCHGIRRHIDRRTGALTECFVPRCAKPEMANA